MPGEEPTSSQTPPPISYRRLDSTTPDWLFVGSFTSIADWHRAKSVLERNGITTRMADSPYDLNATNLLVPRQDVFLAEDLIRRMNDPEIEQAMGFPMLSPPPLPKPAEFNEMGNGPEPAGTMRVLELSQPSDLPGVLPNYGCAIAGLWILLGVMVLLVLLFFATSQA